MPAIEGPLRDRARDFFQTLQDTICEGLQTGVFIEDLWSHPGGGGGRSRTVQGGDWVEKGAANFSAIRSDITPRLSEKMNVRTGTIFATGISVIIHPVSPMVPTVHMNLRYLERDDGDSWFGGGIDLTPCYLFEEDARHFHRVLKVACDKHDPRWYPRFKRSCDEYFYLPHRQESRGIGGIFFDNERADPDRFFLFVKDVGASFLPAYMPIVTRRTGETWHDSEKRWQLVRRGRYVEFNLIYDRGTIFGLETGGRTESILASLPPEVRWVYGHRIEPGSREEALVQVLQTPRSWA